MQHSPVRLLDMYGSSVPIAIYLAAAATVTVIAVLCARETKGIDVAEVDRADELTRNKIGRTSSRGLG
ncbi:hypothetical protein [Nocardia brasiliensis]|uniref:hypothetical protein n=1 Tax=Nocardia brasiliensis TaxID=37326 RepID=UPI00366F2779